MGWRRGEGVGWGRGGSWAGKGEGNGQALGEGQALPFAYQSSEEEPDFLGGCRKGGPRPGLSGDLPQGGRSSQGWGCGAAAGPRPSVASHLGAPRMMAARSWELELGSGRGAGPGRKGPVTLAFL